MDNAIWRARCFAAGLLFDTADALALAGAGLTALGKRVNRLGDRALPSPRPRYPAFDGNAELDRGIA